VPEDVAFDEQLPANLRVLAGFHFTPVAVARDAAQLLAPRPGMRVLDVGSGAGKFCITAARVLPAAEFVGVEWRPHLSELARTLAAHAQLPNVRFINANVLDIDWSEYDAFYMYNPFAEHLFEGVFMLDRTVPSDPLDYVTYVTAARERLADARIGTRIVTFHGFGAEPPDTYEFVLAQMSPAGRLELWEKTRA
jgi:predicted RNA methylase